MFIFQLLLGSGSLFAKAAEAVISKDLKEGGSLGLSLGCLFAFLQHLAYVIQMMKGLTNAFRTVVLYLRAWNYSMALRRALQ